MADASVQEPLAGDDTDPAIPALAVEGLSHSFGERKALDEVSFSVPPGAFTVLLGQNGAGKTTLFSLVTRLYNNRSGTIRVYGFDVARRPSEALARIGVVFQQRTLDLDLTVAQNLRYHGALHGMGGAETRRRIDAELARLALSDRANDKVRQLSGGQIRRIEIAAALLHRPRLMLLDEPTVGLDIGSRQGILDHVRRLCREDGIGLLWATHLIDEVISGDRVVVLHKGRVVADGKVEEVTRAAGCTTIRDAFTKLAGAGLAGAGLAGAGAP